jgi:hypothetical protein
MSMRLSRLLSALALLLALAVPAAAQSGTATPVIPGYLSITGCPSPNLIPCFIASTVAGAGNAGFPPSATPVTGVFSGNASATPGTAVLSAAAGKFTYICGWTIDSAGATAATDATISVGTVVGGNTLQYTISLPVIAAGTLASKAQNYTPCLPANAVNTTITVTLPAVAGQTAAQLNAWGYQQ